MNVHRPIALEDDLQARAEAKAAEMGISLEEYVSRVVADDLGPPKRPQRKAHISEIFDLVKDGPPTDIARDKDRLIGEAVWDNYLRKIGEKPVPARKSDEGR